MESTPGAHGGLDALGAFGVRHHLFARAMGHDDRFGHLRFAQFLHVEVGDGIHDAAGGHQLDPVGAILDVAPHHVIDVVDRVGHVLAARQIADRRERASRRRDRR